MPMLDMPLKELKQYQGKSRKAKDFDAYWARAKADLDKASLKYTLEKADFTAPGVECWNLYFTGVGGATIKCQFVRPEKIEGKAPAIVSYHGYQANAGDWVEKLPYAYAGKVFLALNCRGQGAGSEDNSVGCGYTGHGYMIKGLDADTPDKLYFRNVFLDTAQCIRIVKSMDFVDSTRIGCFGMSQGGGLTTAAAALEPDIKQCLIIFPFLSDYERVWEMDMFKRAYEELAYYLRMCDPFHKNEDKFYQYLSYIDVHNLAPRIKCKTTMVLTLQDDVCPPSTQWAVYNNLTCEKDYLLLPDFGHELPFAYDEDMIYDFFRTL